MPALGPIERAEVVRQFAFRGVPVSAMLPNLISVAMLSAMTGVDHEVMAGYVVDMWKMFGMRPGVSDGDLRDKMFLAIRDSGTSPAEFLDCFHQSRRLVLTEGVPAQAYLDSLMQASAGGVPASDMNEHVRGTPPIEGLYA